MGVVFEEFLTREELRAALAPLIPGCHSKARWQGLIKFLPCTLLPGARRPVYRLSEVYAALDAYRIQPVAPEQAISSPLHRRRPRKTT